MRITSNTEITLHQMDICGIPKNHPNSAMVTSRLDTMKHTEANKAIVMYVMYACGITNGNDFKTPFPSL